MWRRLRDEIYGEIPESFPAEGSPEEAARRLAERTQRLSMGDGVVGRVTSQRVMLRRHRAFRRNSFAPVFRGRFAVESGRTVLRGCFQLHPLAQAFLTVWFGFVGIACVAGVVSGVASAARAGAGWRHGLLVGLGPSLGGVVFGAFGLGLLRLGSSLSRGDAQAIRRHVAAALGGGAPPPGIREGAGGGAGCARGRTCTRQSSQAP